MARIYKKRPGGPWWGDWTDPGGKRHQRTLRTRDKSVAKVRLREAELAETPSARGRAQRLSEAIDYMITATCHDRAQATRDFYAEKGRRIIATLGDPDVRAITRDLLSGYITRRLSTEPGHGGASPHTVSKELITIRRALREAHERGLLRTMPPMPRFSPRYTPRDTWLTSEQFERLAAQLDHERVRWVALAALAGANSSEVESVVWETVDLVGNRLFIAGTKRETRRRWVPIAPALRHRLELVPVAKRHGAVVEPWSNVRRDLHAAVARANLAAPAEPSIPKVSPNDLRRTFASWLVQQGVPLLTVATLLGHSSTRMVERVYGRLSKQNLEAAIAALPNPHKDTP